MKATITTIVSVLFLMAVAVYAQDETWETVSIPGMCTYQIPPTVEIQKGAYKQIQDQFRKAIREITSSPDMVVAQPKGINDFDPVALKRYCRIIVNTVRGSVGKYLKLGESYTFSAAEMKELDKELKKQVHQVATSLTSKGIKTIILSWQPIKIVRVNGVDALLATYTRSVNDLPPTLVRTYSIQNNDVIHHITISYSESEKKLWADDLGKVINTFKFKKR